MTTLTQPLLAQFAVWLRATDSHAARHLALLDEVDLALSSLDKTSLDERRGLSRKLEKWRYQHFNQRGAELTSQDEYLIDALDLAANELTGREPRPPRHTRQAIHDIALETDSIKEAVALLHSSALTENHARRAAELTHCNCVARERAARSAVPPRRRMVLYAPLYVSSECVNDCTYCGFRFSLAITRKHLTTSQAVKQARILRSKGFRHLLIVAGDFPSRTTTTYYQQLIREVVKLGITPAVEIAPQGIESYSELQRAGICGVTLYQETYDENLYAKYHVRGPKSSFHWRLEGLDRAAEAGVARLGLGVLLGLADPREDVRRLMRHAAYLSRRFPGRTLAFSLPRIHEAPEGFRPAHSVSDDQLVRLYCALRIAFPRAELVLSTREAAALRDRLARICITQMSAGSSTTPGGYQHDDQCADEQFPVSDNRGPREVAAWLRDQGFTVAWNVTPGAERGAKSGTHRSCM